MKLDRLSSLCLQTVVYVLVLCIVFIISVNVSWGQVTNITISGTVTDQHNKPLNGVSVWVTNGSDVIVGNGYTVPDGSYSITLPNAPQDNYIVHAKPANGEGNINTATMQTPGVYTADIQVSVAQDPTTSPDPTGTPTPYPDPTTTPTPYPDPTTTPTPYPDPTYTPTSTTDPTITPATTPYPTGGYQQINQAHGANNLYPVIQMNLSWKRANRNQLVTFDAGDTYSPDGYITLYQWDFGDGSVGSGSVVQHAYSAVGTYSVKLTVTDSNGNQRSSWVTAIISDVPPVSIPGNETNATVGEPVTFNGSASYSPDGNIVSYDWYFGDGTNATGAIVTHTYDRPDNYDAMLMVTDDDGINTTAYVTVNVEAAAVSPAVPQADTQTKQGLVLLAGAGIACVILLLVLRKKPK